MRTVEWNSSALHRDAAADGEVQETEAAKFIARREARLDLETKATLSDETDYQSAIESGAVKRLRVHMAIRIQLAERCRVARAVLAEKRFYKLQNVSAMKLQMMSRCRAARKKVAELRRSTRRKTMAKGKTVQKRAAPGGAKLGVPRA